MASLEELKRARKEKLKKLQDAGLKAFPIETKRDYSLSDVLNRFSKLSKAKKNINLAGRIMAIRGQGAVVFADLYDGTENLQVLFKKDEMKKEEFDLFKEVSDIGDFINVSGSLFKTKKKEKTLLIKNWSMLSKSLRPLPEKWHGLQDVEERYRRRYLDILMNEEVRQRFLTRSKIISEARNYLEKEGFMEVETPMLQSQAGGASAKPFVTHHNALDIDLYLRIAPELFLKRLLVGGFNKIYELSRNFRNEGIDVTHNPEFTMLEYYESYSNAKKQMDFVEKMIKGLLKNTSGKQSFEFEGNEIKMSGDFNRVSYLDLLKRHALIENPESISKEDVSVKAKQLGVDVDRTDSIPKILDNIYKKLIRPKLIQPTFINDYPVGYLPLAKKNEENPNVVSAFQLVVGGLEIVKAFSELNDPIDQRERFEEQEKNREAGDEEAQRIDEDYLEAMEYGMPPAGGVGIGIDRLVMLLTDVKNIREVILFPTLRPRK